MASNWFGEIFRITTFGESHGPCIGVVIDGCPAGLSLKKEQIDQELSYRRAGLTPYTSPRKEADLVQILSGVFEGQTTGAPIALIIPNKDGDSSKYEPIKHLLRPGHANYTYLEKYGLFDYRGGGRASARETVGRVAAGAVAKQLLRHFEIEVGAYISQLGGIQADIAEESLLHLMTATRKSVLFCPDPLATIEMKKQLDVANQEGDSLGGIVRGITTCLPAGLGDPVYQKLEATLASAMLSLPASKGFEIGIGFRAARLKGSEHNDRFESINKGKPSCPFNHSGGVLGGISTGMPLSFQVAFKPTSSIRQPQATLTLEGNPEIFSLPQGSRHDPCVAIRAVPIVEAMLALVLADAILLNRSARL